MGRPLRIGLYSPYIGSTFGGGEVYLGITAQTLRDAFPEHTVELAGAAPIDPELYRQRLGLDLSGLRLASTNPHPGPLRRLARLGILRPLRNRLVGLQASRRSAGFDLFIGMSYRVPVSCRARRGLLLCQFPTPSRRGLDGYADVVCQSEYTRRWVRAWWGRDAIVVNPPVDVPAQEPDWSRKRRVILSVGRFVGHGHVKRHDVMVEAFRELVDSGLEGWELRLAGSLHHDRQSRAYLERVRRLATGLPVTIEVDAGHDRLLDLYAEASIYWHAAGYGAPADRPEALEHFGMTTVEAMGHGAAPVVIAAGGQREVVEDGLTGRLWTTVRELEERTMELVGDPQAWFRLARAARARSRSYSRPEFTRRMLAAVEPHVRALEVDQA